MDHTKEPEVGWIRAFVRGIIEELSRDRTGEQVLDYVVHEIRGGSRLEDVLHDPYVRNRLSEDEVERLVASPEVIKAVEESLLEAYEKKKFGFRE